MTNEKKNAELWVDYIQRLEAVADAAKNMHPECGNPLPTENGFCVLHCNECAECELRIALAALDVGEKK